jgi:hypothetical protein
MLALTIENVVDHAPVAGVITRYPALTTSLVRDLLGRALNFCSYAARGCRKDPKLRIVYYLPLSTTGSECDGPFPRVQTHLCPALEAREHTACAASRRIGVLVDLLSRSSPHPLVRPDYMIEVLR